MRIGLIGSGGREHAIAKAVMRNRSRDSLYVYGSHLNPGIQRIAASYATGDLCDHKTIDDFFSTNRVDFVIIGTETPLICGVSDQLREKGIGVVGPSKALAKLEGDKTFMRDLLRRRVGKGSPAWQKVTDLASARNFINETGQVAIKPVGLTGGKGVWVMGVHFQSIDDALEKIQQELELNGVVLLEERLIGEEFSRMAFVSDGKVIPMPVAQDFKYAFDGDQGGMTGGMGSYTMADGSMPFLNEEDLQEADSIINLTIKAIEDEVGEKYRGFLYGQFMATAKGVKVIEYNVRLGDPEAINMMALLDSDVAELMQAIAEGQLEERLARFAKKSSLCKYLVPASYPGNSKEHVEIDIDLDEIEHEGFSIIFASIIQNGAVLESLGSRTLALIGLGEHISEISAKMEILLEKIEPTALRHRKDIGDELVIEKKVQKMLELRQQV